MLRVGPAKDAFGDAEQRDAIVWDRRGPVEAGDPSRIGSRGGGAQGVMQRLDVAAAHGDDDALHRRIEVEVALVFAPIGVSLLVGDQQAGVCVGERRRVRIVVLEPLLGVRRLQQAPPRYGVPGGKLGLQSHNALLEFFRPLDPASGYHDQLHRE